MGRLDCLYICAIINSKINNMTSAHEYFTCFCDESRNVIYQVRQHDMIDTKWDFDKILQFPKSTVVYNWGYDEEDEMWADNDVIPINEFLYQIGGLQYLLKDMNVPVERIRDLDWLRRNLWIRNSGHLNYHRVMNILDTLICY